MIIMAAPGPPSCERCAKPLPDGFTPPRPRSQRYPEGAAGPVRLVKDGVTLWWCTSRCFKAAVVSNMKAKKPTKKRSAHRAA